MRGDGGSRSTASSRAFSARALATVLRDLPAAPRYRVAFSGGLDSTVLLHALAEARDDLGGALEAVHVNHGLHGDAGRWAEHCARVCAGLGVACRVVAVDAAAAPGESPEAAARHARYRAFEGVTGEGEALLTAHHQDDQAETLLLHLLRGSGVRGLAAMPVRRALGRGWLGRPLLGWPRAALRAWAEARGLAWVEDPSNRDERLDRNFLRRQVLPLLEARWPGATRVLARDAALQAQASVLLDALAREDAAAARGPEQGTLSVRALLALTPTRRDEALREWLRRRGLPAPSAVHLGHVVRDVLLSREDAAARVAWPGAEVWRYRDALVALPPVVAASGTRAWSWNPPEPLTLPAGTLAAAPAVGEGLAAARLAGVAVAVRLRSGGERCRLPGRGHHHALKKLLQAHGVPPPVREWLPLVYVGEDLAAVADLWVCEPWQAGPGERGWVLRWQRPPGWP
ncbi:MAG: tRNA lysidine(34) synthetase TilS [Gammaproteobacteria bacterium]|nr:tRNA lysidine(34) synthetase TilS [Gammaproteobacteria bacterium]